LAEHFAPNDPSGAGIRVAEGLTRSVPGRPRGVIVIVGAALIVVAAACLAVALLLAR
jgi:hypothetical protein